MACLPAGSNLVELTFKSMNFIYPVFAAILQAASFTIDKLTLSVKNVSYKTYTGVSFPLIFLVNLVIFAIFQPPIPLSLLSQTGWLIVISVLMGVVSNIIFYRALDHDKLSEMETLSLLNSIPIIIFSSIIFSSERNMAVIIPALIASLAVIWSHWQRQHFAIARYTLPFLIWSLAAAPIAASISKILLQSWNPIALELVRSGALAAIFGILYFNHAQRVSGKAFGLLILTNILTSVAWILFFFSYQRSGIIYTILLFSLQPLLVYFASVAYLKEKVSRKKAIAFGVVLLSIIAAQILA